MVERLTSRRMIGGLLVGIGLGLLAVLLVERWATSKAGAAVAGSSQ